MLWPFRDWTIFLSLSFAKRCADNLGSDIVELDLMQEYMSSHVHSRELLGYMAKWRSPLH